MKFLKAAIMGLALAGVSAPTVQARDLYLGEVILVASTFCPRGTAEADGSLLPISQYTAVFALLGTNYGGDGRTTFGLPDLRGRVPLGQGAGPGLPVYRQGQNGVVNLDPGSKNGGFVAMRYCVALEGIFPSRN